MSSVIIFIHELTHKLPSHLWLKVLGNKEMLEKSQIECRQSLVPSFPSRHKTLLITDKNFNRSSYQSCLVLYSFVWFLYFVTLVFSAFITVYFLRNYKRKLTNVAVAWIEYPKIHHTIPRSWIMEIRNIFVIPENMKATVANSISN